MQTTPLFSWHGNHGGRLVDFAGWQMPIQYSTIVEEHHAVRNAAGLFDISHMGRLVFTGAEAEATLDRLVTNDVSAIPEGGIRYALVCNEAGGVLDDVLVYRLGDFLMLVVNASNREKIVAWIETHRGGNGFEMRDKTFDWAMMAIQGRRALAILDPLVSPDLAAMRYYTGEVTTIDGQSAIISRTGYTGEDGFEVIVPSDFAGEFWQRIIDAGGSDLSPCGLGCRDTLRLESAMPLYGHELSEEIDPYSAGLSFAIKLGKPGFLGKEALEDIKNRGPTRQRIGLVLEGRRIARESSQVFANGELIGEVTSGTFSPTLDIPIAMALVSRPARELQTQCEVDVRGKRIAATVTKLPFYKRD